MNSCGNCFIEATLSPTLLTQPGKDYVVFLLEDILLGKRISFSPQTVNWSQRDIDLKETRTVRWFLPNDKGTLYNLDFYKECPWPYTDEEVAYSAKVQKTIKEHFSLSWQ